MLSQSTVEVCVESAGNSPAEVTDSMSKHFRTEWIGGRSGLLAAAIILAAMAPCSLRAEDAQKAPLPGGAPESPAATQADATRKAASAHQVAAMVKNSAPTASPDFAAMAKSALDPLGRVTEVAIAESGVSSDPAVAATPAAAGTAAATGTGTAPATATAATANLPVPVQSDAVVKELSDMKNQLGQMAAMEAAVKARMAKLENALETGGTVGMAAEAEKEASALRSAETGDSVEPLGQAAAPPPAAAPAPPEISAERLTKETPFAGDWTWLNDNGHQVDSPMATKYFTPEFRSDANYTIDMNHPVDDTLGGSTETFRSDEWQLEQISIGGDIRIDNVRGRFLCLCGGLWSTTTARNDGSVNRGSWDLKGAYQYVAEGWGGYHWDVNHGLNLDAGIFVSYIGLFSYYNFDNWTYQPSFVSSNTPWFFNGLRLQWFPTAKLKIEPWFINGWQSYARPNGKPGLGGQILYRPKPWLDLVANNYGLGEDDTGYPGRSRVHTDDSVQYKYYDKPKNFFDKAAITFTGDLGCEYGGGGPSYAITGQTTFNPQGLSPEMGTGSDYNGGVNCHSSKGGRPKQSFEGWMMYNRFWFKKDIWGITLGGGEMKNPGRYLTLLPPINGATAVSGSPYFTGNPGDRANMHDMTFTLDYMPSQFITFRWETGWRYSDVPYWTGHGGITPPGGQNGNAADYQCAAGGDSGYGYVASNSNTGVVVPGQPLAIAACQMNNLSNGYTTPGDTRALWWPDLRTNQTVATMAVMIRF